jgi:hypothetical protein
LYTVLPSSLAQALKATTNISMFCALIAFSEVQRFDVYLAFAGARGLAATRVVLSVLAVEIPIELSFVMAIEST